MSHATQKVTSALYSSECYASEANLCAFKKAQTQVIEQCIKLLSTLEPEHYRVVLSPFVSGSIGQHVRHIVDHYRALMNRGQIGIVDYDKRDRHSAIEACANTAISSLKTVIDWVEDLSPSQLSSALDVSMQCSIEDELTVCVPSILDRELLYVSSHTIHHFSLISIICKLQNIDLPKNFGIAPSTLSYEGRLNEA